MLEVRFDMKGFDDFIRGIVGDTPLSLEGAIRRGAAKGLSRILHLTVVRARANAPIDTGALRRSILGFLGNDQFSVPINSSPDTTGFVTAKDIFTVGSVLKARVAALASYAFEVHEFFHPVANAKYYPQVDDHTPEGGVGGKYIERVIAFHNRYFGTIMRQALEVELGRFSRQRDRAKPSIFGDPADRGGTFVDGSPVTRSTQVDKSELRDDPSLIENLDINSLRGELDVQ